MERESPGPVIGTVAPATNIMVQPEMEALRPPGVINAHARIPTATTAWPRTPTLWRCATMVAGLDAALDTLAPVRPGHVVLAVMVENVLGGARPARRWWRAAGGGWPAA